jgi:hypothetical protein
MLKQQPLKDRQGLENRMHLLVQNPPFVKDKMSEMKRKRGIQAGSKQTAKTQALKGIIFLLQRLLIATAVPAHRRFWNADK